MGTIKKKLKSADKDRLLDSIPAPEGKDYLPLYEAVGNRSSASKGWGQRTRHSP